MTRILSSLLLATSLATTMPARAQDRTLAPRVDKLEREMRAVQRKVFPGGGGESFAPEIAPPAAPPADAGVPASPPLADLTARVDALEKEVARLTGQAEENSHAIRELQDQMRADRAALDTRLKAIETPAAPPPAAEPEPAPARGKSRPPKLRPIEESDAAPAATTAASAAAPASEPAASASSGDPAEDAYMAGYRLWTDKRYPEAEAALKAVVAKYPKHRRASYAQNLLGRAYLDDGKPAMAAEAFYANYQKMPRGERAPDSLYYLGVSLTRLDKRAEACRVYDELQDVYGATLSGALKTKVTEGRAAARCK